MMDRRDFLLASCSGFFAALLGADFARRTAASAAYASGTGGKLELTPAPLPQITAAVDVLVPPDPAIPGDFKGSDYLADRVVAAQLGILGQALVAMSLDQHALAVAGKRFVDSGPEERLEAIRAWIREREAIDPMLRDALVGLLTFSVVGTYEDNTPAEQAVLYESMGWFDPRDPAGTFRIPNEGYVDTSQFPALLKDGVRR